MARSRNIKPGFFTNEDLAECSCWARLCFIGLWTLADREGRLEDRPKRIKGELFRFDSVDVEPLLQELERFNFILRYEVDGLKAIQILKFSAHQTPHFTEKESVIAPYFQKSPPLEEGNFQKSPPLEEGVTTEKSRSPPALKGGSLPPDSLNPDSLIQKPSSAGADPPPGFARFWVAWPQSGRKAAKAECAKRWKARGLEPLAGLIVAHVEAMKASTQWRSGFEPAPLTYLNQRRWEDEIPAAADIQRGVVL
jgi:hypothetical protein